MRLDHATWPEVEAYLAEKNGIILPVGSTEQHGPMGLIGTDALCAEAISRVAADLIGAFVAPTLAYTPAPFNTSFPGTVSLSGDVFRAMFAEVVEGLRAQGFSRVYVLNGHGANLAPMRAATAGMAGIRIRSWWDFDQVNDIRRELYGEWEGMHATPSEVSITQALVRAVPAAAASNPPRRLAPEEIKRRAGDRHGTAEAHRSEFPDGRVGSHSALAAPAHGRRLLQAAADAVAADYSGFTH